MNRHDDAEQRVSTWLHEEAQGELPDWVLEQTFTTTRATSQRQGLRGRLASLADRDATTPHRRNLVLTLTTMTAVAAGAILATSAVFINTSEPAVPGAEMPAITVEEEMFTGWFAYGPSCVDEGGNEILGCFQLSGVVFDDPRFQGSVRMMANPEYMDQGIYRNQFTITTDAGAWVGDPVPGILTGTDTGVPSVHLFSGDGAYDGLYAVASVVLTDGVFSLEGYVVEGGFPELP